MKPNFHAPRKFASCRVDSELVMTAFCGQKWLTLWRRAKRYLSPRILFGLGVSRPELRALTGVAITPLRPSGTAFINGKRVQVVTEGALVDQGASIKVVAVRGLRVVVREL